MEKIHLFLKFFEEGTVNLGKYSHESENMKKIIFSIFKEIITDLNKRTVVDDLVNKFEIDSSSLWNSFEIILKPELKRLNSKIQDIIKKDVDFEMYNSNNASRYLSKILDQFSQTKKIKEKTINEMPKKHEDQIQNGVQASVNNRRSIKDSENIDFFDYDEMVKFVDEGLNNPNLDDTASEFSDFSDGSETNNASNFKYDDFFVENNTETHQSDVEAYPEENEFDDFCSSEDKVIPDVSKANEEFVKKSKDSKEMSSENMSKLVRDKKKMDAIIDELEENIIKEKEWYKLGESSTAGREKNSLLDIHLEVPQFSSMNNSVKPISELDGGDIVSSDKSMPEDINPYLENIVKQRILNDLFDDVKPKDELLKALTVERENEGTDDMLVEKSKLSLAEIYSKKYEEQVMGNTSQECSDERKHILDIFTEIMCKLDNLSNQYYATNIPILKGTASNENAPALKTEDAIPVIISDNSRLAPQEIKAQGKLLFRSEMTRQERRSDRNSIKRKIKKSKESNPGENVSLKDSSKSESLSGRKKTTNRSDSNGSFNKRIKLHHLIS